MRQNDPDSWFGTGFKLGTSVNLKKDINIEGNLIGEKGQYKLVLWSKGVSRLLGSGQQVITNKSKQNIRMFKLAKGFTQATLERIINNPEKGVLTIETTLTIVPQGSTGKTARGSRGESTVAEVNNIKDLVLDLTGLQFAWDFGTAIGRLETALAAYARPGIHSSERKAMGEELDEAFVDLCIQITTLAAVLAGFHYAGKALSSLVARFTKSAPKPKMDIPKDTLNKVPALIHQYKKVRIKHAPYTIELGPASQTSKNIAAAEELAGNAGRAAQSLMKVQVSKSGAVTLKPMGKARSKEIAHSVSKEFNSRQSKANIEWKPPKSKIQNRPPPTVPVQARPKFAKSLLDGISNNIGNIKSYDIIVKTWESDSVLSLTIRVKDIIPKGEIAAMVDDLIKIAPKLDDVFSSNKDALVELVTTMRIRVGVTNSKTAAAEIAHYNANSNRITIWPHGADEAKFISALHKTGTKIIPRGPAPGGGAPPPPGRELALSDNGLIFIEDIIQKGVSRGTMAHEIGHSLEYAA